MAAAAKPARLTGWALLARDYEMLRAFEEGGLTAREIARKFRTTTRNVERRLSEARKAEETRRYEADAEPPWVAWIVPLFPIGPFEPDSKCVHRKPIKPGTYFYCPVCHQSGMDHRAALRRDPRTDPKPEPKRPLPAARPRTRRQLREAAFGIARKLTGKSETAE